MVVNGNVDGWTIAGNRIHDNNNIGIDAIGFEPTLSGKYRYTTLNRARNGLIADNIVARIQSARQPRLLGGQLGRGRRVVQLRGRHLHRRRHAHPRHAATGSLTATSGSRSPPRTPRGSADHVLVSHNHITGSLFTGIATGGYCNGADDCGGVLTGSSTTTRSSTTRCAATTAWTTVHPNCWCSTTHRTTRSATTRSSPRTADTSSTAPCPVDRRTATAATTTASTLSARIRGSAEFGWSGHTYAGFDAYRHATGQDQHSTYS